MVNFAQENGLTVVGTSPQSHERAGVGAGGDIERAFNVNMGVYQHPTENRTFYAPDREPTSSLPFPLWHVSGLDNFSIPHPAGLGQASREAPSAKSSATTGSGPSASFLGSDMRAAYYGGTLTGAASRWACWSITAPIWPI